MPDKGKQRELPEAQAQAQLAVQSSAALQSEPLSPSRSRSSEHGGTPSTKSRFLRRSRSIQLTDEAAQNAHQSGFACSDLTRDSSIGGVDSNSQHFYASSPQRSSNTAQTRLPNATLGPPQASPQPARQVPEASSRQGGWFANMLSASSNTPRTIHVADDNASIRSFSSVATSPSRFLRHGKGREAVNASSVQSSQSNATTSRPPNGAPGRMAGLDRMLGRAMQYLTDSDSNADRNPDDIWLLGVRHDGWRADDAGVAVTWPSNKGHSPTGTSTSTSLPQVSIKPQTGKRSFSSKSSVHSLRSSSGSSRKTGQSPPISAIPFPQRDPLARRGSAETTSSQAVSRISSSDSARSSANGQSSPHHANGENRIYSSQTYGWPPGFYLDFYSRIQLTYRSGFSAISSAGATSNGVAHAISSMISNFSVSIGRSSGAPNASNREDGPTSDTGWGCMLRTGQSLLANALLTVHIGRDFRRPLASMLDGTTMSSDFVPAGQYAVYVRLLTWFLDDPNAASPFSVHRFAAEGKKLGKEVGEWFGPSTAGGAIKALVTEFEPANLGVVLAMDTTVYQSQVFEAAKGKGSNAWNKPVLILLPLRLGLNGVNPIYFASIKQYFALPQCVGIAGGRPSSSYYFVGTQGDSLFYIDPHHTKPAVKSIPIPEELQADLANTPLSPESSERTPGRMAVEDFFASSYTLKELESFHSEKVRKMHISGLDPSMLLGILCQTKHDWQDLCRRMDEIKSTCTPIIHIVPEMPAWMRAPSRSVSTTAVPATQRRASQGLPSSPGRKRKEKEDDQQAAAEESFEFADSDDWDIDESDDGSLLEEKRPTLSTARSGSASKADTDETKNSPTIPGESAASAPEGWEGIPDTPRVRQISDDSEVSQTTARQASK